MIIAILIKMLYLMKERQTLVSVIVATSTRKSFLVVTVSVILVLLNVQDSVKDAKRYSVAFAVHSSKIKIYEGLA